MTNASRLALFPKRTGIHFQGGQDRLSIGGCDLKTLAEDYGTPLYLYDAATLDNRIGKYRQALSEYYPGIAGLVYAGKAFLCLALAQWIGKSGLWLDCSSAGELHIAKAAGVPKSRLLLHGVNKSHSDISLGLRWAGVLAVDNLTELGRIEELSELSGESIPDLWLRYRPGITAESHSHILTGHEESKFGMDEAEIEQAAQICRTRELPLKGLHFHIGSQLRDTGPIIQSIAKTLRLAERIEFGGDWALSVGGGLGVGSHEDELPNPSIIEYVRSAAKAIENGCRERGLEPPSLFIEPGRSLIARAGVAVYRVGAVKRTPSRRWVLLDGGMADNPRFALYQARYSAMPVEDTLRENVGPAWFGGPYCESGDVLIENLPFPDVKPGELVAVPMSGAYQLSMASNYNGARRPAVLWLEDGTVHLMQDREKANDLLRRDRPLPLA